MSISGGNTLILDAKTYHTILIAIKKTINWSTPVFVLGKSSTKYCEKAILVRAMVVVTE
jgi:hypothetical protein